MTEDDRARARKETFVEIFITIKKEVMFHSSDDLLQVSCAFISPVLQLAFDPWQSYVDYFFRPFDG